MPFLAEHRPLDFQIKRLGDSFKRLHVDVGVACFEPSDRRLLTA